MDALHDHRRNDLQRDLVDRRVRCNVNHHDHRVMDGHCDHHLRVGDRHRMGCFCGVYLSWIVNRAIQNHGHRVDLSIDPPCYDVGDRKTDVSRANRNCVRRDLMMDENLDVNRDHRMNDLLVDRN